MKAKLLLCIGMLSFGGVCCAQTIQYPEAYGVYIKDGAKFTRLEENMPKEKLRNFTSNSSVLVFDRLLTSPLVKPQEAIKIFNRNFVRFNVDLIQLKAGGEIVETRFSKAGDFANLGTSLKLDVYPVKGHQDMIEFKPRGTFKPGLYTLMLDQDQYAFAVGLGDKTEAESEHNGMVDRYFEVTPKRGGFSFDEFGKASERGPFAEKYRGDFFIQKEYYKNRLALDNEVLAWKSGFEQSMANGDFARCFQWINSLNVYDGTGEKLRKSLLEKVAKTLREELLVNPLLAGARAVQLAKLTNGNTELEDIRKEAVTIIAKINSQQLQKNNEPYATDPVVSISYINKPLPKRGQQEARGVLHVYADRFEDTWLEDGNNMKIVANLADISDIELSEVDHDREVFDRNPIRYYNFTFKAGKYTCWYHFRSSSERNAAVAKLEDAIKAFNSNNELQDKITFGNIVMALEDEYLTYVIKTIPNLWSPPIKLPENYAGITWKQLEPKGDFVREREIEYQLGDGTITTDMALLNGQVVRIRCAHNDGEVTGKLLIAIDSRTKSTTTPTSVSAKIANNILSFARDNNHRIFKLDPKNTTIEWTATKKVLGRFVNLGGGWNEDGEISGAAIMTRDGTLSQITATIGVATVWTESDVFTTIIRKPVTGFFLVDKFPAATFVSTAINVGAPEGTTFIKATHSVEGNFQLNGITKSITFPAAITLTDRKVIFEAKFGLDRQTFNCRLAQPPPGILLEDKDIFDDVALTVKFMATEDQGQ